MIAALLGLFYAFLAQIADRTETYETYLVEFATVVQVGGDPFADVGSDTNVFVFPQGNLPPDGSGDLPRSYDSYVWHPKRGADIYLCSGYGEVTEHWFVVCTNGRWYSLWLPECHAVSRFRHECHGWCGHGECI